MPVVTLDECDRGIIESALMAPAAQYAGFEKYPDLPSKAAALTYSLAKSQACIDGNKRIAFILLNEFLAINGAALETTDDDAAAIVLRVAESNPADRDMIVMELTTRLERLIVQMNNEEETP